MGSAIEDKVARMIHECKDEIVVSVASVKADFQADFASMCKAAVEAALPSMKLSDSECVAQKTDVELSLDALGSMQHTMHTEFKDWAEDGMCRIASKMDALDSSVQSLKLDVDGLQASTSKLWSQPHELLGDVSTTLKHLQSSVDDTCAIVRILSECGAGSSKAVGSRDAMVQCGDTVWQEADPVLSPELAADRFDLSTKGDAIVLAENGTHATHCGSFWEHKWQTVYGKHVVEHGKYEWHLQIEKSGQSHDNKFQMVVGVASDAAHADSYFWRYVSGYGYAQQGSRAGCELFFDYAAGYCAGDIVTVVLDMSSRQLSFKKNQEHLGVLCAKVRPGSYRLAVSMGSEGHAVRLLCSGPL